MNMLKNNYIFYFHNLLKDFFFLLNLKNWDGIRSYLSNIFIIMT